MQRNKLLIIEGPDGAGKSTLSRMLADHTGSKLIVQPSKTNCVSFIRNWTKDQSIKFTPTERQFLMAISHSVDAFTEFNYNVPVVMDRSWISGSVYGAVNGMSPKGVLRYKKICQSLYREIADRYRIVIVFMRPDERLKKPDVTDHWENTIRWSDIQLAFDNAYATKSVYNKWFFNFDETMFQLRIEKGEHETETIERLVKIWECM